LPKARYPQAPRPYFGGMTILHKILAAVSILVIGSTTLTGCTAEDASSLEAFPNSMGASSTDAEDVPGLPEKNIDQWVMPLDQYSTISNDRASVYAENLLVQPCMEAAGFSWTVPWRDVHRTDGPSWSAAGSRITNLDLAMKWGYHLAPATDASFAANKAFFDEKSSISAAEDRAFTKCLLAARKVLPLLPGSTQVPSSYVMAAWQGAMKEAPVVAAAARWRECMIPAGIPDLPESPRYMPSPSVVQRFNITFEKSTEPPTVSEDEIALATQDETCSRSSLYAKTFYDTEWDRQMKLVAQNADALERAKVMLAKHDAAVAKVISSHAPNH
jgi:hypothetical protein